MVRQLFAAVAFLVAATAAHVEAVPTKAETAPTASLPSTARMAACPPGKAWHAPYGNAVKIPAAAVANDKTWNGGWSKVFSSVLNLETLIYGRNNWAKSTIAAGKAVISYRLEIPADGRFRWSTKMAAPHTTDWNDFWVRFPAGVATQRYGGLVGVGDVWIKIYTNRGQRAFVWGGRTVDHNPHMLITPWLTKGQIVEFRISGRSNKVAIAYFGLHRCQTSGKGSPKCANPRNVEYAPVAQCY